MATEKRLIDANELWRQVEESRENNTHIIARVRLNHSQEHDHFLRMILNAPTVDAVEVVHGRFVYVRDDELTDHYECSVCHRYIPSDYLHWNYCPNCGAKLDGGADNGI